MNLVKTLLWEKNKDTGASLQMVKTWKQHDLGGYKGDNGNLYQASESSMLASVI